MNNVYFSNEGMTSTECNYLCNIAKEMQQAATERLNSVKFFKTSVAVIGSNEKQLMSEGNHSVDFIPRDLKTVAAMNAFCAWGREAIKEKEAQMTTLDRLSVEEWAEQNGYVLTERPSCPKDPKIVTEKDVIDSWDINKRNKYLRLEAFAATYGKYIHVDGAYSTARKKAHQAVNMKITKEGSGRDMVLYYTEETVPIEIVDMMFLSLQDTYRNYEKELNQMKAEIKESVNELTRKAYEQYEVDSDNYKTALREFTAAWNEARAKFTTWRTNESERISKLKITIPDALKETYKALKEVGDN